MLRTNYCGLGTLSSHMEPLHIQVSYFTIITIIITIITIITTIITGFDPIDTRHRSKHYIHETHVYPPDRIISSFDTPAGITVRS